MSPLRVRVALALSAATVVALSACTSTVTPAPVETTADVRASAVALLEGALDAGSPGATEERRAASLKLAIETLTAECRDPDSAVSVEAYELLQGAKSVLERNGVVPCDVFG